MSDYYEVGDLLVFKKWGQVIFVINRYEIDGIKIMDVAYLPYNNNKFRIAPNYYAEKARWAHNS